MFTKRNTTTRLNIVKTVFFVCAVVLVQTAQAATVIADVVVSPIGDFQATFSDINVSVVKAKDSYQIKDTIIIPWSKISTGMKVRDTHALKYFNADKYPNIEITGALGKAGKGAAKVRMNGVEKVVKGTYEVKDKKMLAEVKLKLSEFNVKDISYKSAGVQDEVVIKIDADAP